MSFNTSGSVTHAGWRIVKPQRPAWDCPCGAHNPRYVGKCLACKAPYTQEQS